MRYIKPALIDLGVLDDVVVIGPDDHYHTHHEAEHETDDEVDEACDAATPGERPTSES